MFSASVTRIVKVAAKTRQQDVRKSTALGKKMLQIVDLEGGLSTWKGSRMLHEQWDVSSDEGDNASQPGECVQMTDDESDVLQKQEVAERFSRTQCLQFSTDGSAQTWAD